MMRSRRYANLFPYHWSICEEGHELSVTFSAVLFRDSILSYERRREKDTSNLLITVSSFGERLRRVLTVRRLFL